MNSTTNTNNRNTKGHSMLFEEQTKIGNDVIVKMSGGYEVPFRYHNASLSQVRQVL